ncbi:TlpA family protein disulfide reductase [Leptospira ryugenii]|uniref:TlpA family protein disulfide reductase n=1 Tax=Leptospira ryugenii TaxID=1917863 RepID=UPI000D58E821|nr:TlpA disulfide reductase family protein [Leptospira ryugenii]
MIFWKNWPYSWKMVLAFLLFFGATLGFARFRANLSHPRISFESLSVQPTDVKAWEGKPKIVYFWATWCTVCKTYSYILNQNLKLLDEQMVFLSVVEDEPGKEFDSYIAHNPIHYPVYHGSYSLLQDWGVSAFPTTVFLNSHGEVVFYDTGIISPLSFWLRSLLTKVL